MYEDDPPGYNVPVCQAILKPRLMLGVPRQIVILPLLAVGLGVIWSYWPAIPPALILHGAAVIATKLDEDWLDIGLRILYLKSYYGV